MSGLNVVGVLAVGALADRGGRKNLLGLVYALRGCAYAALLLAPGAWSLWGFVVIMGFSWWATLPLTSALTAEVYGLKHLGMLNGLAFTGHQLGGALSIQLGGTLRDLTGSYDLPFALAGLLLCRGQPGQRDDSRAAVLDAVSACRQRRGGLTGGLERRWSRRCRDPLGASARTDGAHATQPVPVLQRRGRGTPPWHRARGVAVPPGMRRDGVAARAVAPRVVSATSATWWRRAVSVCRREVATCCHRTPACRRFG